MSEYAVLCPDHLDPDDAHAASTTSHTVNADYPHREGLERLETTRRLAVTGVLRQFACIAEKPVNSRRPGARDG